MTDAYPEEQLLSERIGNIGVCHCQIGLFRGRGRSALTLSYDRPYQEAEYSVISGGKN